MRYEFVSPDGTADPNADPWGGIRATFDDGSRVTIASGGTDEEGRQRYAYSVTQEQEPHTVAAGDDLRSGVGEGVDYRKALGAWTSFACADAEAYQSAMSGTAFEEWAYLHDDELAGLALDLQAPAVPETEEAGPAAAGAACEAGPTRLDREAADHGGNGNGNDDADGW